MGERIVIVVVAIVATLLQVLLAPHIAIGYAVPNFMAMFCLVVAIVRSDIVGPVLPFVMGLLFDLLSGGPVGGMAFSLTAICALGSWFFQRANNDTLFMALVVLVVSVLLIDMLYGGLFLMFGYAAGVLEAFVYRVLPCFIYDAVLAIVLYLIVTRFLSKQAPYTSEIRHLQ